MELVSGKIITLGCGLIKITVVLYFSLTVHGYQPGDRVSALTQTAHNNIQTAFLDLPLPQMPRFAIADNFIFHANLPQQNNSGLSGTRINPNSDLKISFTFDHGKKISRLDPSHPALRGFEVEYKWDSVQEEDFELGVATLFLSGVLGFFLIFFMTNNK
eukprot:gene30212-39418_t